MDDSVVALIAHSAATWRFGVLFCRSGVIASIKTTQMHVTTVATEFVNTAGGIHGRPIEPIAYDPTFDPKIFQSLAHEAIFQPIT